MSGLVRQEATRLHGYTEVEMAEHMAARHQTGSSLWMLTEADHADLHARGADHTHHVAETGALALTVRAEAPPA